MAMTSVLLVTLWLPLGADASPGADFAKAFRSPPHSVPATTDRVEAFRPLRPMSRQAAESRPLRLVIMGAPGSGKGTQSKRIAIDFGVKHVSSGDLLREYARKDPEVADYISRGQLVPFPVVMKVMKRRLAEPDVREHGFVLDGFPRRLEDAIALLEILNELGTPLDAVIKLEVPEEELRRRVLGRGREDDTEAVFRDRMRVYREQTEPVYSYLEDKATFLTPDVTVPDADAAYRNVKQALDAFVAAR